MRTVLMGLLFALVLMGCNRDNTLTTPGGQQEKPAKITLHFYDGSTLLKKWIYELDSVDLAALTGVLYWTDSSYNSFPGQSTFYKVRQEFQYNPSAGMFSSIVSRNYRSGSIRHWVNDQVQLDRSLINNYRLSNSLLSVAPSGIALHQFNLQFYWDSLQQSPSHSFANRIAYHRIGDKKYLDVIYGNNGPWNFFEFSRDSIYLNEDLAPSPGTNYYAQSRYYDYYRKELPWYARKRVDRSIAFLRSPYVCDSFVLRNGDYVFATPTSDGIFTPSLERKISYQYTGDTTAIRSFIDVINPILKDPFWFYTTANAHSLVTFDVREEGNYTDLFRWMSARSVDSVFVMAGSQRQLRQVTTTVNTVEKDGRGRITKITSRPDNSARYKVLELSY